jgi:hypothetical protein
MPRQLPVLVLASSFYTAALEVPFTQALAKGGHTRSVVCVPYNQLFTFLLDPRCVIPESVDASVVLLLRVEDLIRLELAQHRANGSDSILRLLRQRTEELVDVLSRISRLRLTIMMCPSGKGAYDVEFLGNATRVAEHKILSALRSRQKHRVVAWSEFERTAQPSNWFNPAGDRLGHVPFMPEGLDALADFFVGQLDRMPIDRLMSQSAGGDVMDLERFLTSLDVGMTIAPLSAEDEQPVLDLIRHTTHFVNLPNQKWDEGRLRPAGGEGWVVRVHDRFGDYGASGALTFDFEANVMRIHLLFLSCPVLGKQVEYALLTWMTQLAEQRQAERIEVPFVRGRDNQGLNGLLARLAEEASASEITALPTSAEYRFRLQVPGLAERVGKESQSLAVVSAILSKMQIAEVTS